MVAPAIAWLRLCKAAMVDIGDLVLLPWPNQFATALPRRSGDQIRDEVLPGFWPKARTMVGASGFLVTSAVRARKTWFGGSV